MSNREQVWLVGSKTKRTLTDELRYQKSEHIELYRRYFGRIYDDCADASDWRMPLYHCLSSVQSFRDRAERKHGANIGDQNRAAHDALLGRTPTFELGAAAGGLPGNLYLEAQIAAKMLKYNMPLFFVSPAMYDACANTEPLTKQTIADMHLPYEGFAFVLPCRALSFLGTPVHHLSVGRDLVGNSSFDVDGIKIGLNTADDALLISTLLPHDTQLQTITLRMNDEGIARLDDGDFAFEHDELINLEDGLVVANKGRVDENVFTKQVMTLVLNLVNVMEVRPEVVVHQRKIKALRRDRHTELWKPNLVGPTYRTAPSVASELAAGHHGSPIMHPRRGHWRLQGYGHRVTECCCTHAGRAHAVVDGGHSGYCQHAGCDCTGYRPRPERYTDYRKVWIEPTWVNAKQAATAQ